MEWGNGWYTRQSSIAVFVNVTAHRLYLLYYNLLIIFQVSGDDLKEMGIAMGQRKKILLKIEELKIQLKKRKAESDLSSMPVKQLKQTTLSFAPPPKTPPQQTRTYEKWLYKNPQHKKDLLNSSFPEWIVTVLGWRDALLFDKIC